MGCVRCERCLWFGLAMIKTCMNFADLLNAPVLTTIRFRCESGLAISKANRLLRAKSGSSVADPDPEYDPFTMQKMTVFNSPQSRFAGIYGNQNLSRKLTPFEASSLLFNEMRNTSWPYSWYGMNRDLINKMLTHMQRSNGLPFSDANLNIAYKNQIINDNSKGSTRLKIIELINKYVNLATRSLPSESIPKFADEIHALALPNLMHI